jgi:hypothetical protein
MAAHHCKKIILTVIAACPVVTAFEVNQSPVRPTLRISEGQSTSLGQSLHY